MEVQISPQIMSGEQEETQHATEIPVEPIPVEKTMEEQAQEAHLAPVLKQARLELEEESEKPTESTEEAKITPAEETEEASTTYVGHLSSAVASLVHGIALSVTSSPSTKQVSDTIDILKKAVAELEKVKSGESVE